VNIRKLELYASGDATGEEVLAQLYSQELTPLDILGFCQLKWPRLWLSQGALSKDHQSREDLTRYHSLLFMCTAFVAGRSFLADGPNPIDRREMAEYLGIKYPAFSNYLKGRRAFRRVVRNRLLELCGVSGEALAEWKSHVHILPNAPSSSSFSATRVVELFTRAEQGRAGVSFLAALSRLFLEGAQLQLISPELAEMAHQIDMSGIALQEESYVVMIRALLQSKFEP